MGVWAAGAVEVWSVGCSVILGSIEAAPTVAEAVWAAAVGLLAGS
ncbi:MULTISPECIES: hypothetical protein [Prevotella]|nr:MULTISPECIES: hypothetical protein [Prevotella]